MRLQSGGLADPQQASTGWTFDRAGTASGASDNNGGQSQPALGADPAGDGGDDARSAAAVLVVEVQVFGAELVALDFDLPGELIDLFLGGAAFLLEAGLAGVPVLERADFERFQPALSVMRQFGVVARLRLLVGETGQLLALAVEVALDLFQSAMVGDRAGVEAPIGDLDAPLRSLDLAAGFAHELVSAAGGVRLGRQLGVERGDEGWIGDLIEDGLQFALRLIALNIDFLKSLQALKIHECGSFSFRAGKGASAGAPGAMTALL